MAPEAWVRFPVAALFFFFFPFLCLFDKHFKTFFCLYVFLSGCFSNRFYFSFVNLCAKKSDLWNSGLNKKNKTKKERKGKIEKGKTFDAP